MNSDQNLDYFRSLFPHLKMEGIYFDHAAVSPMNNLSRKAMDIYLNQAQGEQINNYQETWEFAESNRKKIGLLINAPSDRIAYVSNTTDGMILLARGLQWNPGDRIVLHRREFPSNVYPWWELQNYGVELDFLDTPEGRVRPGDLEAIITPETKLVTVSWVQYFNGYRNNIAELVSWCHARGILVAVDAMQGLGHLKMNVEELGFDFMSTGTAKWLFGPQGHGFIYITKELQKRIHPPHLGWQSREAFFDFHNYEQPLRAEAGRYEFATKNSMGIHWFSGSLDLLLNAGPDFIQSRVLSLSDRIVRGLTELGMTVISKRDREEIKSGIVTASLPDKSQNQALYDYLLERSMVISVRNDLLRFSAHFYNLESEVDRALDAIGKWINEHTRKIVNT